MEHKRVIFIAAMAISVVLSFYAKAQQAESSIWTEPSSDSRFFEKKNKMTGADIKKKYGRKEAKKSDFKRQVYAGPTNKEIETQAFYKAQENFQKSFPKGDYDVRFDKVNYNLGADVLTVTNLTLIPKDNEKKKQGYVLKMDSFELSGFNLGQKEGSELKKDGKARISKLDMPIFNEANVKKGKLEAAQVNISGPFLQVMQEGAGALDIVQISGFRTEKIIPETVLDNIVRSKVFSASDLALKKVVIPSGILDSLKQQSISGMTFQEAFVNGERILSPAGAEAALTSYSARVLNSDLVLGARLEAQKKQPVISMNRLKENAANNKKLQKEIDSEKQTVKTQVQEQNDGNMVGKAPVSAGKIR